MRILAAVAGLPLRRLGGVTGLLSSENARRNPKRTARTAAALDRKSTRLNSSHRSLSRMPSSA